MKDVIFTGGDPMMMSTALVKKYMCPLLGVSTLKTIRIGTRSLSWWPQRYTAEADAAIRRIRATGAVIGSQSPLVRHVNDDAAVWREMWQKQVQLGIIPYYMFVARNTGPRRSIFTTEPTGRCRGLAARFAGRRCRALRAR